MARAVIVGGGIAGLEALHMLKNNLEVVLITKNDFYISGPSRPLLLSDEQTLDRIVRGYHLLRDVNIIFNEVTSIDLDERKVYLRDKTMDYDYLILATGVKYNYEKIGYQHIFNVYDIGRLVALKKIIWSIKRGTIVVSAPKQPYRCAPAPAETALTIDMVLRHRGVRKNVELIYVDANKKIQPPVIHDVWKERFERAGIEVHLDAEVSEVTENGILLNDGDVIKTDVPVVLPENIGMSPLGKGYLEVRSPYDLRLKGYDEVFVIGELAKLPFPKNSEIASITAKIAAGQILELEGFGHKTKEVYRFIGWAYAGNLDGKLQTESIKFELLFTENGPVGKKDPDPKYEHTQTKDRWEQAVLKKLFGF